MTIAWGLKAYLCSSAMLVVSYLLFWTLRRAVGFSHFNLRHRQWVKLAQALVLLSILVPIGFHSIPARRLPTIDWMRIRPLADGVMAPTHKRASRAKPKAELIQPLRENVPQVSGMTRLLDEASRARALLLMILLLVGWTLALSRLFWTTRRLKSLFWSSVPIRSLGKVRVVVSDAVKIPFSVRIAGKSWVMIPASLLGNSSDMRLALRHEIQHHRQRDTRWAALMEHWVCLFFPNPAVYLWKKEIVELQELSCDEALIGQKRVSPHDYGSCLVRVAEAALGSRNQYAGTTYMASTSKNPFHVKSLLRRRIEMFSSHGKLRTRTWVGAILGTAAIGATVAIAFGAEQSLRNTQPVNPGTLIVDPAIQTIADQVLSHAIETEKARGGFAIVADPNTGRILAVSNFDHKDPRSGHWALSQELEQASVLKGLVAAEALDLRLTTRTEKHDCENGSYVYNGRTYHDWRKAGWSSLTTDETIAKSSDICSMKIGEKIGPQGLLAMLENFGFGPEGTASSLPEARVGNLPAPENELDLVPLVVSGFGFKSTPIEILQAYGAIANGGNLLAPLPADQITPQVIRRVLSDEGAHEAREVLREVVLNGTGKPAQSHLYSTAGKTATAWTGGYLARMKKYPGEFGGYNGDFGAMIGFAPVDAPRVEIYVGILDPESPNGAHGGQHAAPVFKEIAERVLQFMKVPSDQTK